MGFPTLVKQQSLTDGLLQLLSYCSLALISRRYWDAPQGISRHGTDPICKEKFCHLERAQKYGYLKDHYSDHYYLLSIPVMAGVDLYNTTG